MQQLHVEIVVIVVIVVIIVIVKSKVTDSVNH